MRVGMLALAIDGKDNKHSLEKKKEQEFEELNKRIVEKEALICSIEKK